MEKQGMKKLAVLVIILSALLCGSGVSAQQGPAASPVAVARPSEQSHSITVGGRLEPQRRIVHRFPTGGFVQTISVREGQLVEAGQELLTVKRKDDVLELYKPVPLDARIAGRVSEVLVKPEAEVNSGDSAVVIVDTLGYVLQANVSDKDAFRIEVGQQVEGRTTGGEEVRGTLISRSAEPDYGTGLFELAFQFPDSQRVAIGEFVLIDLPIDRVRGLFVPRDAVVRRYGKYFIWIVNESQVIEAREVSLGAPFGDLVLIREGLESGQRYLQRLTGREREGSPAPGASGGEAPAGAQSR
jgi:multidrug efflux pump subunit AcrA (membrane-fusion protein)